MELWLLQLLPILACAAVGGKKRGPAILASGLAISLFLGYPAVMAGNSMPTTGGKFDGLVPLIGGAVAAFGIALAIAAGLAVSGAMAALSRDKSQGELMFSACVASAVLSLAGAALLTRGGQPLASPTPAHFAILAISAAWWLFLVLRKAPLKDGLAALGPSLITPLGLFSAIAPAFPLTAPPLVLALAVAFELPTRLLQAMQPRRSIALDPAVPGRYGPFRVIQPGLILTTQRGNPDRWRRQQTAAAVTLIATLPLLWQRFILFDILAFPLLIMSLSFAFKVVTSRFAEFHLAEATITLYERAREASISSKSQGAYLHLVDGQQLFLEGPHRRLLFLDQDTPRDELLALCQQFSEHTGLELTA